MLTNPPDHGPLVEVGLGIVVREHTNNSRTNLPVGHPHPSTHEILITQRPSHTVFGGYWEIPGGKLDLGETLDECVARELFEEVGIRVRVTGALPEVVHHYDHAHVRLHPRLCEMTPHSPEPQALHVEQFCWCPLDLLGEYEFPPANDAIIDALHGSLP